MHIQGLTDQQTKAFFNNMSQQYSDIEQDGIEKQKEINDELKQESNS